MPSVDHGPFNEGPWGKHVSGKTKIQGRYKFVFVSLLMCFRIVMRLEIKSCMSRWLSAKKDVPGASDPFVCVFLMPELRPS